MNTDFSGHLLSFDEWMAFFKKHGSPAYASLQGAQVAIRETGHPLDEDEFRTHLHDSGFDNFFAPLLKTGTSLQPIVSAFNKQRVFFGGDVKQKVFFCIQRTDDRRKFASAESRIDLNGEDIRDDFSLLNFNLLANLCAFAAELDHTLWAEHTLCGPYNPDIHTVLPNEFMGLTEAQRLFEQEGDAETPKNYQACSELAQLTNENLDPSLYPEPLTLVIFDLHKETLFLSQHGEGSFAATEALAEQFRLASEVAKIVGEPAKIVNNFTHINRVSGKPEVAEKMLGYSKGTLESEFIQLAILIRITRDNASPDKLYDAGAPLFLLEPVKLARTLKALCLQSVYNDRFSLLSYHDYSQALCETDFFFKISAGFPDNDPSEFTSNARLVFYDRLAAALVRIAPKACKKAGLDLDLISNMRGGARPCFHVGHSAPKDKRIELN